MSCTSRLLVLSTLLVLSVSCATSPHVSRRERAAMYNAVAVGALKEGDPTGALQALVTAEKEDNSLTEIHHTRALAFASKGDLPAALISARRAIELDPDFSDALTTLGKLLVDTGRAEEAMRPLKKAAADPLYRESFKPVTILGIVAYNSGEDTAALSYFDRAVMSAPQQACAAYYYRGNMKQKRGDFMGSIADYEKATKRFCTGGYPEAHLALGIAYEKNDQFQEARKKYLEVQARYPHLPIADEALKQLRQLP